MHSRSESLGTIPLGRRRYAPVRVRNNVQEFCELIHILTATLCSELVLDKMQDVLPCPTVGVKESLHMAPRTLDRVRESPSALIDETDRGSQYAVCSLEHPDRTTPGNRTHYTRYFNDSAPHPSRTEFKLPCRRETVCSISRLLQSPHAHKWWPERMKAPSAGPDMCE